jgi:ribosomal protein S18 acetylase RimI-like enzyme
MVPQVELRDAVSADAAALADLNTASWRAAYAGIIPAAFLTALDVPAWEQYLLARIGDPHSFTVVALSGGRLVGFVSGGPLRDEPGVVAGEVYAIYVAPEHYGGGVGGLLLTEAEARLAAGGFADAWLWVFTRNRAGRRFYERRGWSLRPQRAYWVRRDIRRQLTCYIKSLTE